MIGWTNTNYSSIVCALTLLFMGISCNSNDGKSRESRESSGSHINITLIDSDFSLGFTTTYLIEEGKLTVSLGYSDENDSTRTIFQKELSQSELTTLRSFMGRFPLEQLNLEYADENVDDGDQKIFIIERDSTKREIQVSNHFQEDLGKLVDLINGFLEQEHKIMYRELYEE